MKFRVIPVTPYQQNCSLIWCERSLEAAVVDPGGDVERILAAIEQQQVRPTQILLTHGHMDHVGGTAALAKKLELPIIGPHRDDLFWIAGLDQQAQMMGFAHSGGFEPSEWLDESSTIKIGECTLQVIHCPGHTPGHVVLFHEASKTAWVGDVLFQGSIGRTDFPRGDHQTLIDSITTRLWPLGDDVKFVPGHGPMSTFGEERRSNPFVADSRFG